ncbi:MAG: NAD(P)-dependent oxidoreductase [Caulobacterales bacterium 68-7]|nr:MAG: NAD(P)-dependent oxidoreductase [Caulobacterales bacterium 68-7]
MAGKLAHKIILITGAAQGIGKASADAFLREGAKVVATDLNGEKLKEVYAGVANVVTAAVDATDAAGVQAVVDANPGINVVLNCAGWVHNGSIADTKPEDLKRAFDINVFSMVNTIQAVLPGMRERKDGAIINVASVVSSVMAAPNRFAYGVSKAAVVGLTMSVARDFITEGIRCNAISPGTTETPSLHDRFAAGGDVEAARAAFIARQPMGRLGTAEEIAAVALMLASDDANFMTGTNLIIDGGMSL